VKKNILYVLLIVFAVLLTQHVVYGLKGQPVVSQDTAESKVPCPGESFLVFFAKFADDETIQREFTMYPLTKLALDYDVELGPEVFILYLNRDQVQFPVFPLSKERTESSLDIRLEHLTDNNATVVVFIPDTGYKVEYLFRKNGCWRLRRIEDWSM
jgi:hypothetical protein